MWKNRNLIEITGFYVPKLKIEKHIEGDERDKIHKKQNIIEKS